MSSSLSLSNMGKEILSMFWHSNSSQEFDSAEEKRKAATARQKLSASESIPDPIPIQNIEEPLPPSLQCALCRESIQPKKEIYYEYSCSCAKTPDSPVCEFHAHKKCLEEAFKARNGKNKKHQNWKAEKCLTDDCENKTRKVITVKPGGTKELLIKRDDVNKVKEPENGTNLKKSKKKTRNAVVQELPREVLDAERQSPLPLKKVENRPFSKSLSADEYSDSFIPQKRNPSGEESICQTQELRIKIEEENLISITEKKKQDEAANLIQKYVPERKSKQKRFREKAPQKVVIYPQWSSTTNETKEFWRSHSFAMASLNDAKSYVISIILKMKEKNDEILRELVLRLPKHKEFVDILLKILVKITVEENNILSEKEANFLRAIFVYRHEELAKLLISHLRYFEVEFDPTVTTYIKSKEGLEICNDYSAANLVQQSPPPGEFTQRDYSLSSALSSTASSISEQRNRNDDIGCKIGERFISISSEFDDMSSFDERERACSSASSSYGSNSKEVRRTRMSEFPAHHYSRNDHLPTSEETTSSTSSSPVDNSPGSKVERFRWELEQLRLKNQKYEQKLREVEAKCAAVQQEKEKFQEEEKKLTIQLEEQRKAALEDRIKLKEFELKRDLHFIHGIQYHIKVIIKIIEERAYCSVTKLITYFRKIEVKYGEVGRMIKDNLDLLLEKNENDRISDQDFADYQQHFPEIDLKMLEVIHELLKQFNEEDKNLNKYLDVINLHIITRANASQLPHPSIEKVKSELRKEQSELNQNIEDRHLRQIVKNIANRLGIPEKESKPASISPKDEQDHKLGFCTICLEYVDKLNTKVARMCGVCKASYHVWCIKEWHKRSRTCVICKRSYYLEDDYPAISRR